MYSPYFNVTDPCLPAWPSKLNLCREETPVYSGVGSVFTFDKATQGWTPVDGGLSGVFIYHHPAENTYRVIGVEQSTQQVPVVYIRASFPAVCAQLHHISEYQVGAQQRSILQLGRCVHCEWRQFGHQGAGTRIHGGHGESGEGCGGEGERIWVRICRPASQLLGVCAGRT